MAETKTANITGPSFTLKEGTKLSALINESIKLSFVQILSLIYFTDLSSILNSPLDSSIIISSSITDISASCHKRNTTPELINIIIFVADDYPTINDSSKWLLHLRMKSNRSNEEFITAAESTIELQPRTN